MVMLLLFSDFRALRIKIKVLNLASKTINDLTNTHVSSLKSCQTPSWSLNSNHGNLLVPLIHHILSPTGPLNMRMPAWNILPPVLPSILIHLSLHKSLPQKSTPWQLGPTSVCILSLWLPIHSTFDTYAAKNLIFRLTTIPMLHKDLTSLFCRFLNFQCLLQDLLCFSQLGLP